MKESFEKNLNELNETVKGDFEVDEELQTLLNNLSHDSEGQDNILELQRKKQAIMETLRQDLSNIDNPEEHIEKQKQRRRAWIENGQMYSEDQDGHKEIITRGELLTDGDWGIKYSLDVNTIPRHLRKKYLVEEAKHQLRDLLDQQIAFNQESFGRDSRKTEIYRKNRERLASDQETKQAGLIAEKLVKNFLKKLSYDYNLDFKVLETDIYQDVEEKIDFLILRSPHLRNVNIEPLEQPNEDHQSEQFRELGIQFTINPHEDVLKRKREQLAKRKQFYQAQEKYLEDIVLVQINMRDVVNIFNHWQEKKQAGGPDKLLDKTVKQKIFFEVLQGIFSEAELQEAWNKI